MNALIPIASRTIAGHPTETVSAKRLHELLGVGRYFSNWIKGRITQYGFEEGVDYILTNAKTGIRSNVREINYFVTLDMAKELCMVERNDKGRQARRYFIECEKRLRSQKQLALPEPETKLPAEIQKALDERIAYYTGKAHIMIREKLTGYAHECLYPNPSYSALELFQMWSEGASARILMRCEVSTLQGVTGFLSEELKNFRETLKDI